MFPTIPTSPLVWRGEAGTNIPGERGHIQARKPHPLSEKPRPGGVWPFCLVWAYGGGEEKLNNYNSDERNHTSFPQSNSRRAEKTTIKGLLKLMTISSTEQYF